MKADKIFQDGCVLQRRKKVSIWGEAESGEQITVSFAGQEKTVCAKDNKWLVQLDPMEAMKGQTLVISSGKETISLEDVAVGEVWLAGGQSNMEFWLYYDRDFQNMEAAELDNPDIRFYDCAKVAYEEAREKYDFSCYEVWRKTSPEDLKYYSAAAFWFARKLQGEIQVPVGIVGCNYGGTRACCWMDEKTGRQNGEVWFEEYEEALQNLDLESYKEQFRRNPICGMPTYPFSRANECMLGSDDPEELLEFLKDVQIPPMGPYDAWRPCGLYETMLEKVIPYTIAGVLWYQGESDDIHPEFYENMLTGMIRLWRNRWKAELPFLIVQLAPFGATPMGSGDNYPAVRAAQKSVTENVENTWLVSISDCGDAFDIHPKRKKQVGERLALQALHYIYGRDILSDAPECISCSRKDDKLALKFTNAGQGLQLRQGDFDWLKVWQGGRLLNWSLKEIGKDDIVLRLEDANESDGISVSIAQSGYYKVNLYNSAGIPAIPSVVSAG